MTPFPIPKGDVLTGRFCIDLSSLPRRKTVIKRTPGSPILCHHFLRKCLLKNPLTTWYILLVKLDLS